MTITVITEFLKVATVKIITYIYDPDTGKLANATEVMLDIYNPDGTRQLLDDPNYDVAMATSVTGIYTYNYHKGESEDAMDTGRWRGVITVRDGSGDNAIFSTASFSFKVI